MTILGRSEELVSRCVECDLAEPESLASLGGSAPGVVDGILSTSWLQLLKLGNLEELTLNIFPRFGESVMKMPKGLLMSPPKHPFKQMNQPYPGTTLPMIGYSGTKGSRTFLHGYLLCNQEGWPIIMRPYLLSTFCH